VAKAFPKTNSMGTWQSRRPSVNEDALSPAPDLVRIWRQQGRSISLKRYAPA
jgi:hypothetical protein